MDYEEKELKNLIKQIKKSSKEYNNRFFTSIKELTNIKNLSEHFRSFNFRKEKESFVELKLVDSVYAHCSHITRICMDKREEVLFTTGEDTFLKMWDLESGLLMHTFLGARSPITDLCLSNDNRILCTIDNSGVLNIYNLTNFSQIFAYDFNSEIDFIEFIKLPKQKKNFFNDFLNENINFVDLFDEKESTFLTAQKEDEYVLVLVERQGLIHTITFDYESIKSIYTNQTILEISSGNFILNSLCITEGGRFLLMGGNYPFLIIFDLYNLEDNFCVLDTGGLPVVFAAAGRNFKFAVATSLELVFIWEYIPETQFRTGNFKKKNTEKFGAWRRTTINLKKTSSESIHFLTDESYLAMLCSDSTFRIYNNNILLRKINLIGNLIYSYENLCYVVNNDMVFILNPTSSDKIEQTITNKFEISDVICNKDYFIIVDESGRLNYFGRRKRLNEIPDEQFLKKELAFLENAEDDDKICNSLGKDSSFTTSKKEIIPFLYDEVPQILEEKVFIQLKNDFINIKNFRKKFLYQEEIPQEDSLSVEPLSDIEERNVNSEDNFLIDDQGEEEYVSDSFDEIKTKRRSKNNYDDIQTESEITTELESESDFETESEELTTTEEEDNSTTEEESFDEETEEKQVKKNNITLNIAPRRRAAILAGEEIKQQFTYLYSKDTDNKQTLTQKIEKKGKQSKKNQSLSTESDYTESEEEIKRTNQRNKIINNKKISNNKGVSQNKGVNKIKVSKSSMSSDYAVSSDISEISESKFTRKKNNQGKKKIGKQPRINLKKLTEEPTNKKTKAAKSRRIKGTDRRRKRKKIV